MASPGGITLPAPKQGQGYCLRWVARRPAGWRAQKRFHRRNRVHPRQEGEALGFYGKDGVEPRAFVVERPPSVVPRQQNTEPSPNRAMLVSRETRRLSIPTRPVDGSIDNAKVDRAPVFGFRYLYVHYIDISRISSIPGSPFASEALAFGQRVQVIYLQRNVRHHGFHQGLGGGGGGGL